MEDWMKQIDLLLTQKEQVLVAIEGGCASGKTTLANTLKAQYNCNVFHMDDFFLRPEQKTKERLEEVGGNVDYERFYEEVLRPLREGEAVCYRPYCCKTGRLLAPVAVKRTRLNLIEGVYSMHPLLAGAYDFSIFLEITKELQKERLLRRNPALYPRFAKEWIPKEQAYFETMKIKERCDKVLCVG